MPIAEAGSADEAPISPEDDSAQIPGQPADISNDEQEAIRIAVEYYMKKARKIHDDTAIGNGKKEFFVFDTEDVQAGGEDQPSDSMQEDFIKLIKPRRIPIEQPPEDKT
ncbi:MAG: hypothetical protein ACYC5K_05535 [Saccharofermentanales bacterium]